MFAGDTFTVDQRRGINSAVREAEVASGLTFSVRVGGPEAEPHTLARSLLARLPDPAGSVVLLVDPGEHAIEIVTGSRARQSLSDEECHAVAVQMQGSFRAGDLPGGILNGIQDLGERASRGATRPAPDRRRETKPLSGASVRPTH